MVFFIDYPHAKETISLYFNAFSQLKKLEINSMIHEFKLWISLRGKKRSSKEKEFSAVQAKPKGYKKPKEK